MQFHVPNVVSCKIVSRKQRTPLIGAYLPPTTLDHLPNLEEMISCFSGREPIILVKLNTYVGLLGNPQDQQVEDFLVSFGLVELRGHFRRRLWFWYMQMWWQV